MLLDKDGTFIKDQESFLVLHVLVLAYLVAFEYTLL